MQTLMKNMFLCTIGLALLAGCGGGTSGSDSQEGTRVVTGTVSGSSGSSNLVTRAASDDCVADTILATDTTGATTSASVADDCSFSLTLATGKSYVVSLLLGDEFVATLIFDSGIEGFSTSSLPLSDGSLLDLGQITISGTVASAENEALDQCDNDGDGTSDLDDADDDEDGVEDEEEEDCDLDGFDDDEDEDDPDCETENGENEAQVLEVKPRNDPHTDRGDDRVDLDKEVKARLSCTVDRDTVTADTFRVISEDGLHEVACTHEFSGSGRSGNRIACDHESDDFLADTVYVATIDGVMCEDGRTVSPRSWEWLTETSDDDEGDAEDDMDEEDEDDDDDDEEDEDEDEEDEDDDDDDDDDDD